MYRQKEDKKLIFIQWRGRNENFLTYLKKFHFNIFYKE